MEEMLSMRLMHESQRPNGLPLLRPTVVYTVVLFSIHR